MSNQLAIKGVYFNKQYQKYHARIYRNGKYHHLGRFNSLAEAKEAREEAENRPRSHWESDGSYYAQLLAKRGT